MDEIETRLKVMGLTRKKLQSRCDVACQESIISHTSNMAKG